MEAETTPPEEGSVATSTNPWTAVVVWSLVLAGLSAGLSWVLPPIIEGIGGHEPALATVTGCTFQVHQYWERGSEKSPFHPITWTDDRGQMHHDKLRSAGGSMPQAQSLTSVIRWHLMAPPDWSGNEICTPPTG